MRMIHEHHTSPQTPAETLLQDEAVQVGLRRAFSVIDQSYADIGESMEREPIGPTVVTPSGIFVEAGKVALPAPKYEPGIDFHSPENVAKIAAHHASTRYLVYMFNLEELKDPDFKPTPLEIDSSQVTVYRGSGIDIALKPADTDPEPMNPVELDELGGIVEPSREDEYFDWLDVHAEWSGRNTLHLPQVENDTIRIGGENGEPLVTVRERVGFEL